MTNPFNTPAPNTPIPPLVQWALDALKERHGIDPLEVAVTEVNNFGQAVVLMEDLSLQLGAQVFNLPGAQIGIVFKPGKMMPATLVEELDRQGFKMKRISFLSRHDVTVNFRHHARELEA